MSQFLDSADHAMDEARLRVRELLVEALGAQSGGRSLDEAVRGLTQTTCACARGLGLPVERLLVLLKEEWREVPAARRLRRLEATAVLERIVTLCINEYYDDRIRH